MSYIDGFVLVVPKKNIAAYQKMAKDGGNSWMKHGALGYYECIGDDLNPNMGVPSKQLRFTRMAKLKPSETVWFSFIIYKSRKHRDQVNKKVMKEMGEWADKHPEKFVMPFDEKRMAFGGFKAVVELWKK
ncbi:DUF1428 domain-containing protein [Candidatus Uhrbacteria bacterium]|nr:DUF1428 domain-containing protein [Candidatus Uhrbacteria bacterium]